jgi:flagellar basal-body rod protein FlgC
MSLFNALDISATGLSAQRIRMNLIAENLANINTASTPQGGPYRRKDAVFISLDAIRPFSHFLTLAALDGKAIPSRWSGTAKGVKVAKVVEDNGPAKTIYQPQHPNANAQGYVAMPNIDVVSEMVNMISAARAYEANITVLSAAKSMMQKALEIGG